MTKIRLINFGASDCRTYPGPSGAKYDFYKGHFTVVKKPEDALFFLNSCGGKAFEVDGTLKTIMSELKKLVKTVIEPEVVDEENPPEETGNLEPTAKDLADADGEVAPVDGDETTSTPDEVKDAEEENGEEIFTEEGIKALNKAQQTWLITKIQGDQTKIPRYEKDRIALLFKLQGEKNNLVGLLKDYAK